MGVQRVHSVSAAGLNVFSLIALATVLLGTLPVILSGTVPPPETDEGTAAHVFQLSIAALLPVGALFLATADWTRPSRVARRLAAPTVAVVVAFAVLYYYEHHTGLIRP